MNIKIKINALLFGFLAFICCSQIQAQQKLIQVTGRILDLSGSLIPNIKVVAYSQNKVEYEKWSNEDGIYILDLPEGIYTLEINPQIEKYNAFETVRFQNYRVVPTYDGKINLDIPLPFIGDGIICALVVSESSETSKQLKEDKIKKRKKNLIIKRKN